MNVRHKKNGAVGILTLDRPERLNAMSHAMWDALLGLINDIADHKEGVAAHGKAAAAVPG